MCLTHGRKRTPRMRGIASARCSGSCKYVGEVFGSLFLFFIFSNIIVGSSEDNPFIVAKMREVLFYFEFVLVVIFMVDFVLTLCSYVADPRFGDRDPSLFSGESNTRSRTVH